MPIVNDISAKKLKSSMGVELVWAQKAENFNWED